MLHVLDLIFPLRCVGCTRELPQGALCERCAGTLPRASAPRCPHCDLRVPNGELLKRCQKVLRLNRFACAGPYEHPMLKATIDCLKYGPQRDLAPLLANLLDRAIAAQWRG